MKRLFARTCGRFRQKLMGRNRYSRAIDVATSSVSAHLRPKSCHLKQHPPRFIPKIIPISIVFIFIVFFLFPLFLFGHEKECR